jgi:hypothetical protein
VTRGKREGKTTQKDMVSAALSVKGWDAKPAELHAYIKETYNTDLARNVISTHKFQLKKANGQGGGAKRGRKPGPALADFEAVCGLVTRLGSAQVRKLVDMADMFA